MSRSLYVSALLILLAALVLAALPLIPRKEMASAELQPVEVEQTRALLGENEPQLDEPRRDRERVVTGSGTGSMTLTVPRLKIKALPVPAGSTQAELDREGIIHLPETGQPGEEGANTFIVGHALGFAYTRVPYVFYELDRMRPGDRIVIRDGGGEKYVYRVYDRLTVRPADYWVTYPVPGKTLVSLQSCTPIPTFENRLVVRAELVG